MFKNTSETPAERNIKEVFTFNSRRGKPARMLAGFALDATIDIACYRRVVMVHPEKTAHYQRLVRATQSFANAILHHYHQKGEVIVTEAQEILDEIDWSACDLRPTFTPNGATPYSGTEPAWLFQAVSSSTATPTGRQELPA